MYILYVANSCMLLLPTPYTDLLTPSACTLEFLVIAWISVYCTWSKHE